MQRLRLYDVPGGDTVLYDIMDESNGYRQSTFFMPEDVHYENFHNIKHVKCRDDDIFLNSYPKTGTNWLWELMSLMIQKTPHVGGNHKIVGMLEAMPLSVLEEMVSPRILNTHIKVQYLPKDAFEKKVKTIFISRNPKDVAVSFYNHTRGFKVYEYDGKFENYLQMFMRGEVDYGSYPEYLLEWQQYIRDNPDVPVHCLYYEDLKEDGLSELQRLREFLEINISDEMLKEIVENCSIDKMRDSKSNANTDAHILLKEWSKPGFSILRKGQTGDWKNWFTVAQSEIFDAWWAEKTKGLDMFKFRYS